MATDPSTLAGDQAEQDVAQTGAGASGADARDTESGVMNALIRGASRVVGLFRDDEDDSGDDAGEQDAGDAETPKQPTRSEAEIRAEAQREAQSAKDREVRDFRRGFATQRADAGDLDPLIELAEKYGDTAFVKQELAKRGAVYEAGQVTLKETEAQQTEEQRHRAAGEHAATLTPFFDNALLTPVLAAAPEDVRRAIEAEGIEGLDGRTKAVTKAIEAIKAQAAEDAATKLLTDEKFVARMLKTEGFRKSLITEPVANKQLRAYFRGELDEADLNPGVGRGGDPQRENDVMNAAIRGRAASSIERGPTERAAARNRDLDDDE